MKKRYVSLDVFRGLTVALMVIVNNPGSWSCIFPPLRHAAWDGCTPTDLVFPFFLFCVGTSMAFSLSKYKSVNADASKKILKRGALIFLIGVLLNAFPFYPAGWLENLRIFGVLQRIALCYVAASFIALWRKTPARIIAAMICLAAAHVGLLLAFAGPEGAFTLEGCFARRLDVALIGENHVYHGYSFADGTRAPFDPEGLLGVLTGTCTALLGFLAGHIVRNQSSSKVSVEVRLAAFAAVLLVLSQILKIWIPVNKPLWSVSYVCLTAGWACLVLSVLSYLIDRRGWEKPFMPFRAMGMNPLPLYVMSIILSITISSIIGWNYSAIFGVNEWMSLLYAVLFMLLHMAVGIILYKKKIVISL